MSNISIRRLAWAAAVTLLPAAFSLHAPGAVADEEARASENRGDHNHHGRRHHRNKEKMIRGYAMTGSNAVKGKPLFTWGDPYGPFALTHLGVYNANGPEPLPIDENTPDDAVLVTYVDPNVLQVGGATPDDVKPEWINVPLRQVPVNVDLAFVEKRSLQSTFELPPLQQAQVEPAQDITLGQWMKASGVVKISCRRDQATVDLRVRDLIPNREYTVWATLGLPRDGSSAKFFPVPMGGAPNILMTDKFGDGRMKRVLNFCPLEPESANRPLLTINVQYHANHQNYAGIPEPAFNHGWWPGLVTFTQLQFPINVEVLGDSNN